MAHRYGRERSASRGKTSAGEVLFAVARDEWPRTRLEEVYRKLFEGEGVRQGASPEHFVYVTPSSARTEINEVATWIGERFGEPGSTVPKKTPFGYLSGKWDGWITYFSALAFGGDRSLAEDFSESVAPMAWASSVSRVSDAGSPPGAAQATVTPSEPPQSGGGSGNATPTGSVGNAITSFLGLGAKPAPRQRGRGPGPSSGQVYPMPPSGGFVARTVAAVREMVSPPSAQPPPPSEPRVLPPPLPTVSSSVGASDVEVARMRREEAEESDEVEASVSTSDVRRYGVERKKSYEVTPQDRLGLLVGRSKKMQSVFKQIQKIAPTDLTVFIGGETGTGKDLAAQAIHSKSPRKSGPFQAVNCGTFSGDLLKSELFGHERGAFTGADRTKKGIFEMADKGTVFLDEVADLSPDAQTMLLRVLDQKEVRRVGGDRPIKADVRIISATKKNLKKMVDEGAFRDDLYHRLVNEENGTMIYMPALRDRIEDAPVIANAYVAKFAGERGFPARRLSDDAAEVLMKRTWDGNVRELVSVVESACIRAKGDEITAEDLNPSEDDDAPYIPDEDDDAPPSAETDAQQEATRKRLERDEASKEARRAAVAAEREAEEAAAAAAKARRIAEEEDPAMKAQRTARLGNPF